MPIPTKPSISRFLRADPDLSFTKDGVARLFVPVGIKQSVQDAEGHWHDVEPYKTAMVMYGPSAERAHAQFKSGDNFIADWEICYDQQAKGNMGVVWHQDFAVARERLRDWVTISGTRLDRDRATRITAWPGGETEGWIPPDTAEHPVTDRSEDFVAFLVEAVQARQAEQDAMVQEILDTEWSERP